MGTSNISQAITLLGKESHVEKATLSSSETVYGEEKNICKICGMVFPDSRKRENKEWRLGNMLLKM